MLRTTVELSIEDIEALLDALGSPADDDEQRGHARIKLEDAKNRMRKMGSFA
jgi:ElaB/YqjD/DUF883 family membrane-anchored ribosome-binding protein